MPRLSLVKGAVLPAAMSADLVPGALGDEDAQTPRIEADVTGEHPADPLRPHWLSSSLTALAKRGIAEALSLLPGAISIGTCIFLWWLGTYYQVDSLIRFVNMPSPVVVFHAFVGILATANYWHHVEISVIRVLIGFVTAGFIAVPLGVFAAMNRTVGSFVLPLVEVFRPIPAIAWVPVSIMIWPSDEVSIVFITFLGAFFPTFVNAHDGARSTDETYRRAALCIGARPWTIFLEVLLPAALPQIVTGLTLGIGISWISLIAAEMISGQYGIGYFTWESYSLLKYPGIIVGMLTIGVLGLGSSAIVRRLGMALIPWRE
jgi:NitT/TauT family transport system permease protein